ncbi:MAG: DUF6384 family protein, partial [Pseudomonadales bacterium]
MVDSALNRTPLEEMMLAMDVVDTLRHHQDLVDRELDADARRERMIARLREIYTAQGIDVTDAMLAEGVRALEEDRFKYSPPGDSFGTSLARLYVNRGVWIKPVLLLLVVGTLLAAFYYFAALRPAALQKSELPNRLDNTYAEIVAVSKDTEASGLAQTLLASGKAAINNDKMDEAVDIGADMNALLATLKQAYQIRIVSRADERSGVWRVPDVNSRARNYYVIVEAVTPAGTVLKLPITSEENGSVKTVDRWGVRVDEEIFDAVKADKQDDGIIQQRMVGEKERGQLDP